MQSILVHTISISRQREHHYFTIRIPADVDLISGIATSVNLPESFPEPAISVGMLQLQAPGKLNICFNSIVVAERVHNIPFDLGYKAIQAGFMNPHQLWKDGLAQRRKNSPETILLDGCQVLYGNFSDIIGKNRNRDMRYIVTITLWVVKKPLP